MRWLIFGTLGLLLCGAAHAAQPAARACAPSTPPQHANAQDIVNAAASQWRAFGYPILDVSARAGGDPFALGFNTPVRTPDGQDSRMLRMGYMEDDSEIRSRIEAYWGATPTGAIQLKRARVLANGIPDVFQGAENARFAVPWSAAFISWAMCQAGLSTDQFSPNEYHVQYMAAAFRAETRTPNPSAFIVRRAETTPIAAGDLVCFASADLTFEQRQQFSLNQTWNEDSTGPEGKMSSHCDIVVGFTSGADNPRALAIGGNIIHGVTMSILALDQHRVLRRQSSANTHLRPFFAVMQFRAGPGDPPASIQNWLARQR